jgi:hypothetical protein
MDAIQYHQSICFIKLSYVSDGHNLCKVMHVTPFVEVLDTITASIKMLQATLMSSINMISRLTRQYITIKSYNI